MKSTKKKPTNTSHPVESTLMVLGAAGLGVGLMYLLDGEQGRRRRAAIASHAEHALSSANDAVGATLHGARMSAKAMAERAGDYAHHVADDLNHKAHEVAATADHRARGFLSHASDHAHHLHNHLMDRAHSLWSRAKRTARPSSHPIVMATGISAASLGILGLGAGLMFILDPSKGRARRAWVRDKAFSFVRRTGREARSYGKHLSNRVAGQLHDVRHVLKPISEPEID